MRRVVLALAFLLAACDSGPVLIAEDQEQGVPISPDLDGDLTFNKSATVQTAFVNGPSRTVYVSDLVGLPFALERREGNTWVRQTLPYATAAVMPTPLALQPTEFRPLQDLRLFELDDVDPGTYRLMAFVFEDRALKNLIPESQRVSPPFRVVR